MLRCAVVWTAARHAGGMQSTDTHAGLAWWQDGIIPADAAVLPLLTHAVHYATCCIEGIRADPTADGWSVLQLAPHLARLARNGRLIGLDPPPPERMRAAVRSLLLATPWRAPTYIRPLVFQAGTALGPTLRPGDTAFAVIVRPSARRPTTGPGLRLLVSSLRHIDESSIPSRVKASAGYLTAALARAEAARAGCDDAILLDSLGQVAEASAANIMLVREGSLIVPGYGTALLEGLTQRIVLATAARLGIGIRDRPIARGELACADEILLCSTAMGLAWAGWLDGLMLPHGADGPGPIAARLLAAWDHERVSASDMLAGRHA